VSGGSTRRAATTTTLVTAAGAACAGVLVAVSPELGVTAVLGVLALLLAVRLDPRTLAVAGLIIILLAKSLEIGTGFGAATYSDELATAYLTIVLVGRRLWLRQPLRQPPGIWLFGVFTVFGVLSSIVSAVPLSIASAGGILVVKGVLLYFALAQIDWTTADIPWLARISAWVLGIALACAAVNLVLPVPWTAVLANTGHPQYRSFLPSLIGPFTHPLLFGNFMALAGIACAAPLLYWAQSRATAKGARPLLVGAFLGAVLSFRRTAIVGMLASLGFLALRRRSASLLLTAVLVVPIAGLVLYPVIHEVYLATYTNFIVDGMDNARTRMTVDSVTLAFQHFPFGVGFGRFGSAIARDNYSIEYLRLGYDNVYGLGSPNNPNNHGRFLTDTQWPAILGEAGLVGALFFVAGLWRIFSTFRKAAGAASLPLRLLGVTGMGWMVHIILESVAYPVFVTTPTSPMLFGLAAIAYVIWDGSSAERAAAETSDVADDAAPDAGVPVGPRAADREARFGSRRRVGAPSDAPADRH
jgi:hypothetical protein